MITSTHEPGHRAAASGEGRAMADSSGFAGQPAAAAPLLRVAGLSISFARPDGSRATVLHDISLTIHPGQTLAVVGESGCGKSVTAMSILRLLPEPAARIDHGSIEFNGIDLARLRPRQLRAVRGRDIAMIFQEPMTSLNPVFTVGSQIVEAVRLHHRVSARQARKIAIDAMAEVGISRPAERFDSYPHEFSGGMRQRVMIAMALACQPKLLLADEPTTALDVTIQAQILDLLRSLQRSRGMGLMLITHDLGIVAQHADVVCVMYAGRVVEYARVKTLFEQPLHPYTAALLRCRPTLTEVKPRLEMVSQAMQDSPALRPLRVHRGSLTPWWPPGPESIGSAFLGKPLLVEAAPEHWVGCWGGEPGDVPPQRAPDIPISS